MKVEAVVFVVHNPQYGYYPRDGELEHADLIDAEIFLDEQLADEVAEDFSCIFPDAKGEAVVKRVRIELIEE